jgi:N-acetylneuraminic acid mutarotase
MKLIFSIMCMTDALIFCTGYLLTDSIFHSQIAASELPQISHWFTGKNMSIPREEINGVSLNGKIYVIGGSEDKNKITDKVDYYDPVSDEWHSVTPLPTPRDHIGASVYDNKIFVVGGFDVHDTPTNELLIYDPQKNSWEEGSPMPTSRGALTAEFINGILYAVGGVDSLHNVVSTVEAYDPQSNKWSTKSPMPSPRHHASATVVDGKLYVLGGRLLGNGIPRPIAETLSNLNDNEVYDPQKDGWKILPRMPLKNSGFAAASVNSSIYIFGGHILNGTLSDTERYNTINETWLSDISMPTARLGLDAVSDGNKI